ncbi:MAG: hypothetical protein LBH35_06665 [Treponema sp.]|jgi:flagellar biosynthesis/type III secretory pathway M-ring protein FliF/YscJ|nr:hypothetical protein [Treponema sp.]
MSKLELLKLLVGVISSWQVIAVTIVLVLYFMLVFHVARLYHRPRAFPSGAKKRRQKPEPAPEPEISDEESDALGLDG